MNIRELNEALDLLLYELKSEDVEPEMKYVNKLYPEIVDDLFKRCELGNYGGSVKNDVLKFKHNGEERELVIVVGKTKLKNIGLKHIYQKHGVPLDYKPHGKFYKKSDKEIMQNLKQAVKNVPEMLQVSESERYYYLDDPTKFLMFDPATNFVYVFGLASNEHEVNFLITTFYASQGDYVQDLVQKHILVKGNPYKSDNTLK